MSLPATDCRPTRQLAALGRRCRAAVLLLSLAVSARAAEAGALRAVDVLERSIEAMGGLRAFARVREIRLERTLDLLPDGGTVRTEQHAIFPHTMALEVIGAEGRSVFLYEGRRVSSGPAAERLAAADESTRDWLRGLYWREWWVLYSRHAWHGVGEVRIEGPETVIEDGVTYHVLEIRPRDAGRYRLWVDAATWRPAKREFRSGERTVVDRFSDFRRHDGIVFPMGIDSTIDGRPAERIRYQAVSVTLDREPLDLERRLDAILRASLAEKRIPGLVAMIRRGDRILLHRAYGRESVELDLPTRRDTVLPLASVSKIFAGAAAMLLVEDGRLDLDASIARYLPGVPESHAAITPRHLLNHSHGLAELFTDEPGPQAPPGEQRGGTSEHGFAPTFARPLQFVPGRGWAYSLVGYEVLQAVLESASGTDYESLIESRILEPLGMASAAFGGSDRIVPGRLGMDYIWKADGLTYNYLNYSADNFTGAGLNATAADVMTFYRALAEGELLPAARRDEMWREVLLESGEATSYGLAWDSHTRDCDGRWSVGHSGGGSSWTRHFPDADLTIVVLSNLNGAREDGLVYDLAAAVAQAERLAP